MKNKAQIKIQEMAFVLIALILLAGIVFIFYLRIQSSSITKAGESIRQQETISLLDKIVSIQELSCQKGEMCIDEDKALIISKNQEAVKDVFQNIKIAKVKRIYPEGSDIVLYQSGKANQSYASFINLCKQDKVGYSFEWVCGLAQLELWT